MDYKNMSKYIIYKIYVEDYLYIGSTTCFQSRKSQHCQASNHPDWRKHNNKLYQHIRVFGGWDNWKMEIVEEGDYVSKRHMEEIEDKYIMELGANLNSKRAYIKSDDWKSYRKEYFKARLAS